MSYFFKNTKRFSVIFTALILTITLMAGSFATLANGLPDGGQAYPEDMDMVYNDIYYDDEEPEPELSRELPEVAAMSFNIPTEMNGAYLTPGTDFIKTNGDSADTVKKQIDDAVESVTASGINTVVIDTVYGDKVIYDTADSDPKFADLDLTGYITEKCRDNGLFVYAIFDASAYDGIELLEANLSEFAAKHKLDGILIDGYEGKSDETDYSAYIKSGGSMGYDNFLNQKSASIAKTASKAIRKAAPDTQAGLLANPVWANASENSEGTNTKAEYTSLGSGYSDTKSYIELGWFDFVAVKATASLKDANAPFSEVVSWWSKLAEKKSIPLYIVYQTSKVGQNGWTNDTIDEQATFAANENAYRGAIFDSLKSVSGRMASIAPVMAVNSDETDAGSLVKPIPAAALETSAEPETVSAKTAPVSAAPVSNDDGQDDDDYSDESDSEGDIIKSISPMGAVTGELGDDVKISVVALKDADVIATLNGESIYLSLDTSYKSSDAAYGRFTGVYTVPDDDEDDSGEQFLGALSVYASVEGRDENFDGAYFATAQSSSSKKYPIQIITEQTPVYPASTRDLVQVPSMYPLPKGAITYALGSVTVKDKYGVKHKHLVLESGLRIAAENAKKVKSGPKNNSIKSFSVSEKSGYTYITVKTDQKVTYGASYNGNQFTITFGHTTKVPSSASLKKNNMFSKAAWSGKNKLTLTLSRNGGFMGFKSYYDGDDLVFRFNNPPTSIKNAKIFIDPGHGGNDVGAVGKNPTKYEKDITLAIAKKLEADLKARGATVKMLDNRYIKSPERPAEAEKWGADMYISIHCNTAPSSSAKGTEVYYFYPYSKHLAATTSLNTSKQMATTNRGAKNSYYNVTLSPQMASVLVETGFFTNSSDYKKLRSSAYHQRIAAGIANGIEGALKTAYTGKISNGTEFKSPIKQAAIKDDDEETTTSSGSSSGKVTSVSFSDDTMQIRIGETVTLKPSYKPSSIKDVSFAWRTSNSSTISVDDNGSITGLKAGTATITATADDGSKKKASIRVTVLNEVYVTQPTIDVSGVALSTVTDAYLDEEYTMIYPGNKHRIEIMSHNGKVIRGADFKWQSSDTKVASVDANGIVTARNTGDAVITATGGGYTFNCEIEVSRTKVAVKEISLEETSIIMAKKTSKVLRATVLPKNATDKSIRWSSSNARIAEVNQNGVIIAQNAGKATITARTKEGGYVATCTVEVLNKAIELEEIYTDFETLEMRVGDSETMYIEYYPENTTSDPGLDFTSSNSKVVSVDSEGNMTALAAGTATITATSKTNKKLTTRCKITVF